MPKTYRIEAKAQSRNPAGSLAQIPPIPTHGDNDGSILLQQNGQNKAGGISCDAAGTIGVGGCHSDAAP